MIVFVQFDKHFLNKQNQKLNKQDQKLIAMIADFCGFAGIYFLYSKKAFSNEELSTLPRNFN